jgi:hypothetical protein
MCHVLTGVIQLVVADGWTYVSFDMICHNRMNFTKKNPRFHPTSLRVYWIGFVFFVAYNFRSLLPNEHFLYFLLFIIFCSRTCRKHEGSFSPLFSSHLLRDHGLICYSLTCRSLQFTLIVIMIPYEHVWVWARNFVHNCLKFTYEISNRIDYVGGVVSYVGGNLFMETADGLVGVGCDLRRFCNNCAVNWLRGVHEKNTCSASQCVRNASGVGLVLQTLK